MTQRPLDLTDDAEGDGDLALVEIGAAEDRAQIVVDAVGVVLVEKSHLQKQLARALMEALDTRRIGERARGAAGS